MPGVLVSTAPVTTISEVISPSTVSVAVTPLSGSNTEPKLILILVTPENDAVAFGSGLTVTSLVTVISLPSLPVTL